MGHFHYSIHHNILYCKLTQKKKKNVLLAHRTEFDACEKVVLLITYISTTTTYVTVQKELNLFLRPVPLYLS